MLEKPRHNAILHDYEIQNSELCILHLKIALQNQFQAPKAVSNAQITFKSNFHVAKSLLSAYDRKKLEMRFDFNE